MKTEKFFTKPSELLDQPTLNFKLNELKKKKNHSFGQIRLNWVERRVIQGALQTEI